MGGLFHTGGDCRNPSSWYVNWLVAPPPASSMPLNPLAKSLESCNGSDPRHDLDMDYIKRVGNEAKAAKTNGLDLHLTPREAKQMVSRKRDTASASSEYYVSVLTSTHRHLPSASGAFSCMRHDWCRIFRRGAPGLLTKQRADFCTVYLRRLQRTRGCLTRLCSSQPAQRVSPNAAFE